MNAGDARDVDAASFHRESKVVRDIDVAENENENESTQQMIAERRVYIELCQFFPS